MRKKYLCSTLSIWYVLIAAGIVRILLPVIAYIRNQNFSIFYSWDSWKYIPLARELLEKRVFAFNGVPEVERTPAYPLLLTIGLRLGHLEIITTILQIVLSCITVYFVFKISLLMFKKSEIAIFSAILYAFEPLSILYSSKLSTETLFTTFSVLFLYLFLKYFENGKTISLITSSVVLSILAYIRPIAIYLNILMTVILFFYLLSKKQKLISLLIVSVVFLFISTFLIGIWQVRNISVAGYHGFSLVGDITLYEFSTMYRPSSDNFRNQVFFRNKEKQLQSNNQQLIQDKVKTCKFMRDEAINNIFSNLPFYLKMYFKNMNIILFSPGITEYLRLFNFNYQEVKRSMERYFNLGISGVLYCVLKECPNIFWLFVFFDLLLGLYYFLGIIPLFSKRRLFSFPIIIFVIVVAYFLSLSSIAGTSRYRHPIMPFICVLGGYGLWVVIKKLKCSKS